MYCASCGKIIDDYSTVCSRCGAPVAHPKPRTESPYLMYPPVMMPAPSAPPAPAPAQVQVQPAADTSRKKKHRRNK